MFPKLSDRIPRKRKPRRGYRFSARAFLAARLGVGETCPVMEAIKELRDSGINKLVEIHHMRGRKGRLLLNQQFWMAVSKQGHQWIHDNPAAARKHGWLCPVEQWNKQP
jgi:hypothetical protein